MNTPLHTASSTIGRTLRVGSAVALTLFAALSVQAADAGQQTYQRVVLGDTRIAAPAAEPPAERVLPGSYARYLIKNGMDSAQALATAQATGESPIVLQRDERVASDELTGRQRYDRAMGRDIAG